MRALGRVRDSLWFGIPLLIVPLVALRFDVGAPITDLFHEGEYLASAGSVAHAGQYGYPVLVHGLLNFLPFDWATQLWGAERAFAGTRAINAFLTMLAMAGYVACAGALVAGRRDLRPAVAIVTSTLFLLVNGRVPNHVYLHQGAPAIRDLLLLPELLLLILASHDVRSGRAVIMQAGAGLLAALGLFWAYNRGLMGIGLLGTHMAVWAVARRRLAAPLAAAAGLAVGLIGLYLADPTAFAAHLRNMHYWATHGSLWQLHASIASGLPFYLPALALMGWTGWQLWRARSNPAALEIGAVLLIQALAFLQVAYARPDAVHFAFGLPALLLLGLFALCLGTPVWRNAASGARVALAVLILIAVLDMNASFGMLRTTFRQDARNLQYLASGLPRNESLLGARERVVAQILAQEGSCTYMLEGSGVLYALSGRPSCSRFLYPSYAGPPEETGLIAELAAARPRALIVASRRWSMFLDGRSPAQRVPRLQAWIDRQYPLVYQVGDFTLRVDRPLRISNKVLLAASAAAEFENYNPQAPAPR